MGGLFFLKLPSGNWGPAHGRPLKKKNCTPRVCLRPPRRWLRPGGVTRSGGSVNGEFFRVVILLLCGGAGRAGSTAGSTSHLGANNAHLEHAGHPGFFGGGSRVWEGAYARMFII